VGFNELDRRQELLALQTTGIEVVGGDVGGGHQCHAASEQGLEQPRQ